MKFKKQKNQIKNKKSKEIDEEKNEHTKARRYDHRATGPTPKEQQIPGKHYCTQCSNSYKHRKDLYRHVRER